MTENDSGTPSSGPSTTQQPDRFLRSAVAAGGSLARTKSPALRWSTTGNVARGVGAGPARIEFTCAWAASANGRAIVLLARSDESGPLGSCGRAARAARSQRWSGEPRNRGAATCPRAVSDREGIEENSGGLPGLRGVQVPWRLIRSFPVPCSITISQPRRLTTPIAVIPTAKKLSMRISETRRRSSGISP